MSAEDFEGIRELAKRRRAKFGVKCPRCIAEQPRRQPTILEPGHRCRVHKPPYVDPRPELTQEDYDSLIQPEEPKS